MASDHISMKNSGQHHHSHLTLSELYITSYLFMHNNSNVGVLDQNEILENTLRPSVNTVLPNCDLGATLTYI